MENLENVSGNNNSNINQQNTGKAGGTMSGGGQVSGSGAGYGANQSVSGNPDVNFGADESGSNDVEINTGGLGDNKEVDLDRSGVNTESGESGNDSAGQNLAGTEGADTSFDASEDEDIETSFDEDESDDKFYGKGNRDGRFGNEHSSSI